MKDKLDKLEKLIFDFIGKDIDTGNSDYCKKCGGYQASGECDGPGRNQTLADLRAKVPELVKELINNLSTS